MAIYPGRFSFILKSLLILSLLSVSQLLHAASSRPYVNTKCGFSLQLPSGWTIQRIRSDPKDHCWFEIDPPASVGKSSTCSNAVLVVDVLPESFDSAAKRVFHRKNGQWVLVEDWNEEVPANDISGPGWKGISVEHVVRDASTVGEMTSYEVREAVISNGVHSATFSADTCLSTSFDRLLRHFRFVPK
jgi:hypothetical protein